MKLLCTISLCLLLAGRGSNAQNKYEDLQKTASIFYSITDPVMSEDGQWLTLRKIYDSNKDTVLLFNTKFPEKPAGFRVKVNDIVFTGNEHLLMQGEHETELLNLKEQTGIFYREIKKIQYLKSSNQFLLHYEKGKLELRRHNGDLLNSLENVQNFYPADTEDVYAVTENNDHEFEVVCLADKTKKKEYSTTNTIDYLEIDPGGKGLMIYERNPESFSQEILYLDLKAQAVYPLKEVLPLTIQNGFREVIRDGSIFFLRLLVKKQKTDTSLVDIWYGNDNRLEEKFYPPIQEQNYVWEPKKRIIRRIGNEEMTTNVNLGNDHHFVSFDSYHLHDYLLFNPVLKVYSYGLERDHYSLIDTINSEFYASPRGEYILYPKKEGWCLYHTATGTRRIIGSKQLKTPYFTPDGKYILFTGEIGLWKYEPEKEKLAELESFKGYEITFLNSSVKVISHFRLYKNRVNLEEPLVVRLYDKKENISSFVLWHKDEKKVIIPPTSKRIQYLTWNDAFDRYSYIEENFSLPPRLVYRELLKGGKVLYQSNHKDKQILSLKQEIVTYTNSGGIPLKGVLYYPLHFEPSQKHPMVVHIYEVQNKLANHYPLSNYGHANSDGFNLRFLLEKGYFVFFPDIVYGEAGTGLSALDCVNHALNVLMDNISIDKNKIGLIGHSHGGYQTNFIATHSDRFAAYVSGAGNSDIVRSYFSFNNNFISPFYWQYENGQYRMTKSFTEDKHLYIKNNPIYFADQVNAPILLWTGREDQNIYWEQTMEFYIGLKRNRKKVVALFYPDEGHTLSKKDASTDLTKRILDWFDYHLKNEEDIEWIDIEMKKDAL